GAPPGVPEQARRTSAQGTGRLRLEPGAMAASRPWGAWRVRERPKEIRARGSHARRILRRWGRRVGRRSMLSRYPGMAIKHRPRSRNDGEVEPRERAHRLRYPTRPGRLVSREAG